ncbi:hypothetical protein KAR91_63935 [Candidatus Pacearchaeota archaeon]|nr:hypothetical protein [Candidatus Pacearchaeota archaeon]
MSDIVASEIQSDNKEEVSVIIDGEQFKYWTGTSINLSMDSIDTFGLDAPFQPDVDIFRNIFVPVSYKQCSVYIGGEPVINGTMLPVNPDIGKNNVLSIGGYSLPGVLNDCPFPFDAYPIEYNNQTLEDIANTAASFFGLSVQFDAEPGAIFERVAATPETKILAFLTELAKQRGLIISNTLEGALLFQKSVSGSSTAALRQADLPGMRVALNSNAQSFYSSITGLSSTKSWKKPESFTVEIPFVDVLRPFVFTIQDAQGVDIQTTVKNKASRMFGEAFAISVTAQGWRSAEGNLWQPNTIVTLQSDGAMIYNETAFLIRSIGLRRDNNGDTSRLELVFPETFNGEIPESLPWL